MPRADTYPYVALASVVRVDYPDVDDDGENNFTGANKMLAAALVLRGERGVDWRVVNGLAKEPDVVPPHREAARAGAFRMSVSRLRKHLPKDSIVDMGNGWVRLDLPPEDVDIWHLRYLVSTGHPLGDISPSRLQHLVQPEPPYGADTLFGVEAEDAERSVRRDQRDLLVRLARERPDLLQGPVVDALHRHLDEDPNNERLIATLALFEARSGNRLRGLEVLRGAADELAERGLTLSQPLQALELALLLGEDDDVVPQVVPVVPSKHLALPSALAELRLNRHIGHAEPLAELETLIAARRGRAVVLGPSGSGKTRLCAELAARAADAVLPTVYLRPQPGDRALEPLRRALQTYRKRAEEVEAQLGSAGAELTSRLLGSALDAIAEAADPAGLLLIVDDVDALDSTTARLVRQLPLTDVSARVVLVVVDSPELEGSRPSAVAAELADQPGTVVVRLGLLDESDLRAMVQSDRDLTAPAVWNLAQRLLIMSGGRAGVAWILLDAVPGDGGAPDHDSVRGVLPLIEVIEGQSDAARMVGGAASVIGEIDLWALAAMTNLDGDAVLSALDELVRPHLVRNLGGGSYEIAHGQVVSAFLAAADPDDVRTWHLRAAEHFAADIHRRARHEAEVADLLPEGQAVESLLESARIGLAAGDNWEATERYRKAVALTPDGRLRLDVEGRMARALDLSGLRAEAERVRDRAFNDAMAADDHNLALAIATSGLPEAESVHANTDLVRRLERLDPDALDDRWRWEAFRHLSRQYGIAGRAEAGLDYADRAEAMAAGPGDRVTARVLQRFIRSEQTTPIERLTLLEGVADDVDQLRPADQADYCFPRLIDHYEAGQADQAQAWRDRLEGLEDVSVLRRWHLMLFDAAKARDQGQLAAARDLRAQARQYGVARGINEAEAAYRASKLAEAWFTGDMSHLRDQIRPGGPLDLEATLMQRAGAVATYLACGETDTAVPLAVSVCEELLASPVGHRSAALAWIADALAQAERPDLVQAARELLAARSCVVFVYGAFVTTFGPVAFIEAQLADSDDARRERWLAGIGDVEAAGCVAWAFHGAAALAQGLGDGGPLSRLRAEHPDSELTAHFAP